MNRDLRTPLARTKGLGSAHEGVHHWWHQRVTAIGLIALGLWFFWVIIQIHNQPYAEILNWAARPWNATGFALLTGVGFYHSYLGLQVIIEDYVHNNSLKRLTLLQSSFYHITVAVLCLFFIIRIVVLGTYV